MLTKLRVLSVTGPTVVELRANFISLSFEDYGNDEPIWCGVIFVARLVCVVRGFMHHCPLIKDEL